MKLFANTGTAAWLWQRLSALVLLVYIVFMSWQVAYPFLQGETVTYDMWGILFSGGMRILGLVALFCLLLHAWLGMWIVITDYIPPALRQLVLLLLGAYLIVLFGWLFVATS